MMRAFLTALFSLALIAVCQGTATTSVAFIPHGIPPPSGGAIPFVALHTYFMSPTGSDGANGLTTGTAWATPNHALNCGDVIIAAVGSYADLQTWGTVSNCPSTSGGIDGAGGVYFAALLCGGGSVGDCYITAKTNTSGNTTALPVTKSNWAVEGWYVNTGGYGRAFEAYACVANGGMKHHIVFINDISANNKQASDTNDCGTNQNSATVPSPVGTDYFATVGMIAQNSSQDTICLGAIDVVYPGVLDTNPGTHYFIYGNFSYAHVNPTCRSNYDTEDYMFDTFSWHNSVQTGIIANNIGYGADRMCIQLFDNQTGAHPQVFSIYNNTCFRNNLNNGSDWLDGEINVNASAGSVQWTVSFTNNIAYQPLAAPLSGTGKAEAWVFFPANGFSGTMTNTGNFYLGNYQTARRTYYDSTYSAQSQANGLLGSNTYTNPAFTNTADLLANQVGVPNCAGFATTTACMGWNANTSTLTTPSIISDLMPTATGTAGKGYQLPSTTCAPNADYPIWLKGVVYLHWDGTSLTEKTDLVTKPCGL